MELCHKYGRSKKETLAIHTRVMGLLSQVSVDAIRYFAQFLEQLEYDAGLDIYRTLDPALPPADRLQKSLAMATERYAGSAGAGSAFDPASAIPLLSRTMASAMSSVAATLSVELLEMLPSLSPLAPLSPALASWQ